MDPNSRPSDFKMDPTRLYHEEVFTDHRVGTIRRLTPVTVQGDTDAKRPVRYEGQTQILTPMGAIPLSFEIEAKSLGDAAEKFAAAAEAAFEHTARELQELRREASSGIVIPEVGPGGLGPGGLPGGGKIQLP